jgi:hypothetical protein
MKTVSSIVENYIKTKPFLLLSLGIINLTLSRNIMSELESEFGKKSRTIVMSLKD